VVPADDAYSFSYGGRMQRVSIPRLEDVDVTYPTRLKRAMDYFYRIPEGRRPWITALDEGGRGLIQTSTARQKGRKLFLWGTGPGGRRWQEWLAVPGHAYIEIQAGLTRTQSENLPMPPGADWSWTEAYGLMQADPAAVHGADWARAREDVDTRLEALIPRQTLEAEYRRGADVADRPPADILQCGSGWGALERLRREAAGDPPFCGPSLVFGDETLGEDQAPWLALLRHGEMPRPAPGANPCSCVVQSEWRALLERAVSAGRGAHWMAWLQLGVMRYAAGEPAAARQAWEESLALNRTAWALRNLAILAQAEQRRDEGADLFVNALRLRPDLVPLAAECGRALVEAGRSEQWLDLLAGLPPAVRNRGRLRLLEGRAALATGDLARVEETLAGRPTIEDLRESEVSLTDLWFGLHAQRLSAAEHRPLDDALRARVRGEFPPPPEIDFRMNVGA
jgi:hypothetical protein